MRNLMHLFSCRLRFAHFFQYFFRSASLFFPYPSLSLSHTHSASVSAAAAVAAVLLFILRHMQNSVEVDGLLAYVCVSVRLYVCTCTCVCVCMGVFTRVRVQ